MGYTDRDSVYENVRYIIPDPFEGKKYELVKLFYPVDLEKKGKKAESKRIIIKGEAGSGKSTLLKRLYIFFLQLEENRYEDGQLREKYHLPKGYTPVYLRLKRLKDHEYLSETIQIIDRDMIDQESSGIYKKGKYILLLDGIDEIPDEKKAYFLEELKNLTESYPDTGIIITGRPAGFEGAEAVKTFNDTGFEEMSLKPMTDTQVFEYGCKRFELTGERDKETLYRQRLSDMIDKLKGGMSADIMRKPLELEIMLGHISGGDEVTFTDRVDIFGELLSGLLGRREPTATRECVCGDLMNLLGLLAYYTMQKDSLYADDKILDKVFKESQGLTFCSEKRKPSDIEELKGTLLHIVSDTGILEETVEEGKREFSFPIRPYQEFLCAYACCNLGLGKDHPDPLSHIREHINDTLWQGCITFILSFMERSGHGDTGEAVRYVFRTMNSEAGIRDIIVSGVSVDKESARCMCKRFFEMIHPWDTETLLACIKSDDRNVWEEALGDVYYDAMEEYAPAGDCSDVFKPYLTSYSLGFILAESEKSDPVSLLNSGSNAESILGAQLVSLYATVYLGEMLPQLSEIATIMLASCVNVTDRLKKLYEITGDFVYIKALSDLWVSGGASEEGKEEEAGVRQTGIAAGEVCTEEMVLSLADMIDASEDIYLKTWELSLDTKEDMINADSTATLISTLGSLPLSRRLEEKKIQNLHSYGFIRGQFMYLGDLWMIERIGSAFANIYCFRNRKMFKDLWEVPVKEIVEKRECGRRGRSIYRLQTDGLYSAGHEEV